MHSSSILVLLSLDSLIPYASAKPVAQVGGPASGCYLDPSYTVEKQETAAGPPITGSFTVDGTGGGSMNQESAYTVGVTVEVGGGLSLDLAAIAGLDLSASVSYTTETSSVSGAGKDCPDGDWDCSLIIWPGMLRVSGTKTSYTGIYCTEHKEPYTVLLPKKGADGTATGRVDVCACKNSKGWADPGAPSITCPQDCVPGP